MRRFQVVSRTDTGRTRDHNEDALLVMEDLGLLAVADGMGGLAQGEVASRAAMDTLAGAAPELRRSIRAAAESPTLGARLRLAQDLAQVAARAAFRILHLSRGQASGTTFLAGAIAGDHLLLCHIGDSRAYLLRDGRLLQVTEDHTVAASRVRAGLMTEDEHDRSPYQHILTQALGTSGELEPDLLDVPLAETDRILLCSDGLSGPVPPDRIAGILQDHLDLEDAADALVEAANEAGGPDNITVVVAELLEGAPLDRVKAREERLRSNPALGWVPDTRLPMLRMFLEEVFYPAGTVLHLAQGLHLVVEGEAVRPDGSPAPATLGHAALVERPTTEQAHARTDLTALVLAPESLRVLRHHRPSLVAALALGLVGDLVDARQPGA